MMGEACTLVLFIIGGKEECVYYNLMSIQPMVQMKYYPYNLGLKKMVWLGLHDLQWLRVNRPL